MSAFVKALEALLDYPTLCERCGCPDGAGRNHKDRPCKPCADIHAVREAARNALDAVPVLEWKREPAYSPGGTEANGCERARVGNYSLTVLDDGGWYAVAWSTPLASVGPRTTPEAAKVAAVNWLARQGVPFRTVCK